MVVSFLPACLSQSYEETRRRASQYKLPGRRGGPHHWSVRFLNLVTLPFGSRQSSNAGCGLNALNDHPTMSLASLAPELRNTLRIEDLTASVLSRFDNMFAELVANGGAFEPFNLGDDPLVQVQSGLAESTCGDRASTGGERVKRKAIH